MLSDNEIIDGLPKGKVSKYRRKLILNFIFIFFAFSIVVTVFQFNREKNAKQNELIRKLDTYADFTYSYIKKNIDQFHENGYILDSLLAFFPSTDVRVTVIKHDGVVCFDSDFSDFEEMDNHINRPEIKNAIYNGSGHEVRHSKTTGIDYFYYAKKNDLYIIRAALPYDISIEKFLKVDSVIFITILLMFLLAIVIVVYLSDRIGKSITQLQQFAEAAAKGEDVDWDYQFPDNELGAIGLLIVKVYIRLQKAMDDLNTERNKLFRHLQISHEGIAIFSKEKKQLLVNNHFVQFLNNISNEASVTPDYFYQVPEFEPIIEFIDGQLKETSKKEDLSTKILTVKKNGKYYLVQAIVFQDKSFEISINDVTEKEKEKILKQQMTSNISHELKTPVSSILGYLETILTNKVDKDKKRFFLERSYIQTQRLSSLIQDISLLNKIEEASDLFQIENVSINEIVYNAIDDLSYSMRSKEITVSVDIDKNLEVKGNKSVFFSIWRNLIENSINYAGEGSQIRINNYLKDEKYLYFSFSDNGTGIPEEHLSRIFERFYRVDSGRSRSMGGSGLGLAIVKNGVIFHKGEISVKNLKGGGVEFIFSIARNLTKQT